MEYWFADAMIAPEQWLPLAQAVEKAGYTGMTIPDSLCYPEVSDSKYPYTPTGDRTFLDGKPFLDVNFECFRELNVFLTACKEASDAQEPLPPLPVGPAGLEDEMAAMLCNFGITAAYEEATRTTADGGDAETDVIVEVDDDGLV